MLRNDNLLWKDTDIKIIHACTGIHLGIELFMNDASNIENSQVVVNSLQL